MEVATKGKIQLPLDVLTENKKEECDGVDLT